jgi:hypothetical protein
MTLAQHDCNCQEPFPKEIHMTAPASTSASTLRELALHATRIQLASLTALSKFFAGWAQSSDRYVHAVSDELLGRVHGHTASSELVGRLADVSSLHLRELTALPTDAASYFKNELTREATPRKRPPATRGSAG